MLKVKQSNKFKNDYTKYLHDIENISNEKVKKECYSLLNKLVAQFNLIDAAHETTNTDIDPTKVRENVENSIQLRQRLNSFIKDSKSIK